MTAHEWRQRLADARERLADIDVQAVGELLELWIALSPFLIVWGVAMCVEPRRRRDGAALALIGLFGFGIAAVVVGVVVFGGTALVEVVIG